MDKFISYAQNLEDVILWRALRGIACGFYIDIGANHPVNDSVTNAFYDRGWHGINIEPIQSLHSLLTDERSGDINLCCAISSAPGTAMFYEIRGAYGLSTLERSVADEHAQKGHELQAYVVPVRTMVDVCATYEVTEVHFLKIDVEGAEKAVLEGMPFDRIKPWIIVVEATKPNSQTPSHQEWEGLLTTQGYSFVYFDGANRFYLSDLHLELAEAFRAPPNVFDNYIQYHVHRALLEELSAVRQELSAYRKRLAEIRASVSWKLSKPLRGLEYILSLMSKKLKGFFHD